MTATRADESVLEALDFDHEVPCETRSLHESCGDGPAVFLVREVNKPCGHNGRELFCCVGCWVGVRTHEVHCRSCDLHLIRDKHLRIVRVIGGAS